MCKMHVKTGSLIAVLLVAGNNCGAADAGRPPAGYLGDAAQVGLDNTASLLPNARLTFRDEMSGTGPHFKMLAVQADEIIYVDLPAPGTATPEFEAVKEVRLRQRELARNAGVEYREFDLEGRSVTYLHGLPPELEDVVVESGTRPPEEVVASLYPYFGFTGTEELRFAEYREVMGYHYFQYRQFIKDNPTPAHVRIYINPETRTIREVSGTLHLDRNYPSAPNRPLREARDLVWNHLREEERTTGRAIYHLSTPDELSAEVVYEPGRGLVPAWRIKAKTLGGDTYQFRVDAGDTVTNLSVFTVR